jgi:signal peptidase I
MRGELWRQLLKLVLIVGGILAIAAAVLRAFFIDVVTVTHSAMAPTIFPGDQVLVWRGAQLDRNDIALCQHPQDAGRWVIGRVAATEGQSIGLSQRGQLLVNGRPPSRDIRGAEVRWHDPDTGRQYRMRWGIEEFSDYEEHLFFERVDGRFIMRNYANIRGLFLLSDNRAYVGEDSRAFGPVARNTCRGQVFMRLTAAPTAPEGVPHGFLDLLD